MLVETFTVGMLSTNCYVASCRQTKETIIIDPGLDLPLEAQPIFDYVTDAQLKIKYIINTHGHDDHVKADAVFQEKYNVPICIHSLDMHYLSEIEKAGNPGNVPLEDGAIIEFGTEKLTVMHTPGHTPGSICLVGAKLTFTGDTLFAGSIGRTDFEGGSMMDMQRSLQKLVALPAHLIIYPGHGETSMLLEEKRMNPFLNNRHRPTLY
jgi:glyoxylase-like metal-dependent hydrolase (beta-lactamase superfamily II)